MTALVIESVIAIETAIELEPVTVAAIESVIETAMLALTEWTLTLNDCHLTTELA